MHLHHKSNKKSLIINRKIKRLNLRESLLLDKAMKPYPSITTPRSILDRYKMQ